MDESKTSSEKLPNKTIEKIAEINSPESPLSKMSIMPNPLPNAAQLHGSLDGLLSPKSVTQLEFPTPERLLPIGQHAKDGMISLADKVREVLSISDISHLKQESSFEKSEVSERNILLKLNSNEKLFFFTQSTGNDVTHSSQANSPRRLTKQSAFELPHSDIQHNVLNSISNAISATNQKNDPVLTQRQRLRKAGPFAVDSQSIPDSRIKYAGSWPPTSYESDSDNMNSNGPQKYGTNAAKQVIFICKLIK